MVQFHANRDTPLESIEVGSSRTQTHIRNQTLVANGEEALKEPVKFQCLS